MKRLLRTFMLIVFLCLPVFAGHTQVDHVYCNCGTPGCMPDYPGECGSGYQPMRTRQSDSPGDATAELGIAVVALLMWLRLKA